MYVVDLVLEFEADQLKILRCLGHDSDFMFLEQSGDWCSSFARILSGWRVQH